MVSTATGLVTLVDAGVVGASTELDWVFDEASGVFAILPLARTEPLARWACTELGAATPCRSERRAFERPAVDGFDETMSDSLADVVLGPMVDFATDDSLVNDFEGEASAVSAYAVPAVANAVPIPNATASAPIRPICEAQKVGIMFAGPEIRTRKGVDCNSADGDSSVDIFISHY